MSTLILYGSRKGSTKRRAEELAAMMSDCEAVDARNAERVDLSRYEAVAIGSSIWAGKIHVAVRRFLRKHRSTLLTKRIGLFVCCGEETSDHFHANIPADVLAHAVCRSCFGGELDIGDFGPLMRFVLRKKAGVTASYSRVHREAMASFVAAFSQ